MTTHSEPITADDVTVSKEEAVATATFPCPICSTSHTVELSEPHDNDRQFGCSACGKSNYLFPVVGTAQQPLRSMPLKQKIAHQLDAVRVVSGTGRANDSMVTQSIKLLFPTTTGLLTALFSSTGFILVSIERELLPTLPFWATFTVIIVALALGIASLAYGPPAYLLQLYNYIQRNDDFETLDEAMRAIGNYHHVYPFVVTALWQLLR